MPHHTPQGPSGHIVEYAPAMTPGKGSGAALSRAMAWALAVTLFSLALLATGARAEVRKASFAGGCFWCVEADFEKLDGVLDVVSGFTGGTLQNPTYRGNHEGHYEAAEITYDSDEISYEALLTHFWRTVDPLDAGGQFCDRGFSYKTAIFVANEEEREAAERSLQEVDALFPDDVVATVILPAGRFWPVEEYHQDYAKKNPLRYKYYRFGCGRDKRVKELWGDKDWRLLDSAAAE
ncbi:peptide-methionine (S)-S-oxide reductase MsrA [Congregibacter litoralis]|uniref:Peptide methionine sulfoxide reductase MsrA n=1 Tax=Congregibacter litoralis KT71 TaxID=314285 RepID=A4A418_9GAMM|nr:peptide-methionine (S)-S-oxide reductase MsrA [Congregibacter litoralis]EAQ99441.2 methionine-S-sulfoxide reductase [Congregibacter litoralis KT71]